MIIHDFNIITTGRQRKEDLSELGDQPGLHIEHQDNQDCSATLTQKKQTRQVQKSLRIKNMVFQHEKKKKKRDAVIYGKIDEL